jgi:hypothetical protein
MKDVADPLSIDDVIKQKLTLDSIMRMYDKNITEREVDYILWNETCYPFDMQTTLNQIHNYFQKQHHERC